MLGPNLPNPNHLNPNLLNPNLLNPNLLNPNLLNPNRKPHMWGEEDFRTEDGSSQGQNLALTGLIVPRWLDSSFPLHNSRA